MALAWRATASPLFNCYVCYTTTLRSNFPSVGDNRDKARQYCAVEMIDSDSEAVAVKKPRNWRWFLIGLSVRLMGVALIWLGDGHDSIFRKGMVVIGVIFSIGGIGVLRYLLIAGFRKRPKKDN